MKKNFNQLLMFLLYVCALFLLNYTVTPSIVGIERLQVLCRPHYNKKFDSPSWHRGGVLKDGKFCKYSSSFGTRFEMLDDLLASHLFVGMAADQAKMLVGEPDGGVVDRKQLSELRNPYGWGENSTPEKTLASNDEIAFWSYHLARKRQYPARSILFPMLFGNADEWTLLIEVRNGKVFKLSIQ